MKKFVLYIIIIFLISTGFGIILSYTRKNNSGDILAQNIISNVTDVSNLADYAIQASASEEKITQNTIIVFETVYQDCKHTVTESEYADSEFINLTKEELEEKYPDWIITEFSEDEVSIYRQEAGLCDEHFKITIDEDDNIIVYHLNSNYDTEIYQKTDISAEYLPDDDLEELTEGIYIYGTANLNSTLESYE